MSQPIDAGASPYQAMRSAMSLSFTAFREPRGVMRIIQFIFSICAFATTTGFANYVEFVVKCDAKAESTRFDYDYPFRLDYIEPKPVCEGKTLRLYGDFSSDAQFFVATGVLSFLYCIGIIVVYLLYEHQYQNNNTWPIADFSVTVFLALLWLSGSAAWANGLSGLKYSTDPNVLLKTKQCGDSGLCTNVTTGSFSSLEISVIFGFLNFFLWASDLWFLYKETSWFKMKQMTVDSDNIA